MNRYNVPSGLKKFVSEKTPNSFEWFCLCLLAARATPEVELYCSVSIQNSYETFKINCFLVLHPVSFL